MKRRTLLTLLPLLGWSARAVAQDAPRRARSTAKARQVVDDGGDDPPKKRPRKGDAGTDEPEAGQSLDKAPANFPREPDFEFETFDIAKYTALSPTASSPQTAILDWIFRRTETGPWHGDKIAVLCANRTQIRAYNSRKILDQVAETVEQFTEAQADVLTVRVRFLAAADSRWRYATYSRLTPVGTGPQGQQIWQTAEANIEGIIAQMQVWQGFLALEDKKYDLLNGQTLKVDKSFKKSYPGGVQREGAVGLGYQPKVEALSEGIVLRFSPLLGWEGDTLDAAIELTTNLIRRFHTTPVLGPKEIGTGEVKIEVPEVSETRLNQAVKGWALGQALIISSGIQPGLLLDKGGLWGLKFPGTVPTGTEILCVINVEIAGSKGRAPAAAASSRDRDKDRDRETEPAPAKKRTREPAQSSDREF